MRYCFYYSTYFHCAETESQARDSDWPNIAETDKTLQLTFKTLQLTFKPFFFKVIKNRSTPTHSAPNTVAFHLNRSKIQYEKGLVNNKQAVPQGHCFLHATFCLLLSVHMMSLGGLVKFRTIVWWYGIRLLLSQRAVTISSALVPRHPDCPTSCSLGAHGGCRWTARSSLNSDI